MCYIARCRTRVSINVECCPAERWPNIQRKVACETERRNQNPCLLIERFGGALASFAVVMTVIKRAATVTRLPFIVSPNRMNLVRGPKKNQDRSLAQNATRLPTAPMLSAHSSVVKQKQAKLQTPQSSQYLYPSRSAHASFMLVAKCATVL